MAAQVRPSALADARRERLGRSKLLLLFTPELCVAGDPLAVLEATLPSVDLIQVRPKAPDVGLDPVRPAAAGKTPALAISSAREVHTCCSAVLDMLRGHSEFDGLVFVNDRVDVAAALSSRGCAGVHLGQSDMPTAEARAFLGEDQLIGLSTHTASQVTRADADAADQVDLLGFGPIWATQTKGYLRGLGPEAAWVASCATSLPLFPIGGIGLHNVSELDEVGRAAVSSAILGADDPAAAAATLRALL